MNVQSLFQRPFITLLTSVTLCAEAATWERLPPLPEPNAGFIRGTVGEAVVIAGGTNWKDNTKRWLDRIWVLEPGAKAWRDAGQLATPCAYAVSGQTTDALWFAGGSDGTHTHATVSSLDERFAVNSIATIEPRFVFASGTILNDTLYVFGGAPDQSRPDKTSNACFAIALPSRETRRIADLPTPSFASGAAAACAGRIFVFGGAKWDAPSGAVANLSTTFAYHPLQDRWETPVPYPFAVRGVSAATLDAQHIYAGGGYKSDAEGFTDEAFTFDAKARTFRPAIPLPIRAMTSLVKCGEHLYCLGGEDAKMHRTAAVFRIRWKDLLGEKSQ